MLTVVHEACWVKTFLERQMSFFFFFLNSAYSTLHLISWVSCCSNTTVLVSNCGLLLCVCVCVSPRQLLKTELGSFFTEYLQNQLLTKGMVILRDKIRFYEGTRPWKPHPCTFMPALLRPCSGIKSGALNRWEGTCLRFNYINQQLAEGNSKNKVIIWMHSLVSDRET